MSELYFVRHGQASYGQANYDQLSPLGHTQSRLLGEYFRARGIHFDRIVTGEMARHEQTLASLLAGCGQDQPHERHAGWNEFDFERLIRTYLQQHPSEAPPADAPRAAFYGLLKRGLLAWAAGELSEAALPERWSEFEQRVAKALHTLQQAPGKERVLVVSSGGAIAMAVRHILAAPATTMVSLNLQSANTGLSRCFFNADSMQLHSFNNLPHLDTPAHADNITFS
ncbi:histidine phosphatase family protein [Simiduia aestuariiviva]|uniref:Broad specificity phosphatase PhoE n=1 Tax=Simiduia aestuariiviva TaxID=1510459 RepID=A0A839UNQ1_9GAMM|nr:histidine phosphatase family protein [Simiduia aestuariiviva]MBB3169462.1 broad specificity phosphatase PhoE [Simiduia aestuariiviva]